MSKIGKNSHPDNYYSGGLAELVSTPTVLTYSFFKKWFTGKGSIGKAMKILGLPYQDLDLPVLDLVDDDLVVNLSNEEKTLYKKTIFKYRKQNNIHEIPQLVVDLGKVFNPVYLFNTFGILLVQSKWIANPKNAVDTAKKMLETIPEEIQDKQINQIDELLQDTVWPVVIAVGLLSEFNSQYLAKETRENLSDVNRYISKQLAGQDWFFRSVADQKAVQKGNMSFSVYIKKYGIRADKDYELTCPRWHEIPKTIKERIKDYSGGNTNQEIAIDVNSNIKKIIDTSIQLQLLRSEAKRKAL